MATTTTNFGWDIPQSTDLVKDGATAIAALGQDIDTALIDLKGGTTGQVLAKASGTDLDYTWSTPQVGDITEVTAGTGISGGGTSGNVTVTNSMATAIDAKGDLIAGTGADTFSKLTIGANNTILTADSGEATGMKWAAPASSGGMTVLASGTLSGTALDLTSISASYTDLVFEIIDANWGTSDDYFKLRLNNLSTSIYTTVAQGTNTNGSSSSFYGAGSADRLILWGGVTMVRTGKNSIYLTIPDYATAKGRRDIFGNICGQNSNANETAVYWTGFSTDSTAISRITFSTQTGYTFSSGSYKLWGIK
jgi:hypothetical protein